MNDHDDKVSAHQIQDNLIGIATRHFAEEMLPKIGSGNIQPDDFIALITGSVSFGFCDSLSDVDVVVYMRSISRSAGFAHNSLLEHHSEGTRVSYRFADFGEIGQLLDGKNPWETISPHLLFNLVSFVPIHDPSNVVGNLKSRYDFYPESEFVRVVRGLWITICDSGLYQSNQSFERGNLVAADIAFFRGLEALMRMIYILNRRYFPPTKWLETGLRRLEDRFGWQSYSPCLQCYQPFEDRYDAFEKIRKKIKDALRKKRILDQECIESYGANFRYPFRVFSSF